jgi:hypothetical protein
VADHQTVQETRLRKNDRRCLQSNAREKARHARRKRVGVSWIGENGTGGKQLCR